MSATLDDILDSPRTRRPVVMGILNVTPDSFSDGGQFFAPAAAVEQARRMQADGADVIDIGAESTRPGSLRVPADEQIARLREILPTVTALGVVVSIDTTLSAVAAYALDCGAAIINDVSAGRDDPEMLPLAAQRGCPIVLMHMLGQPKTMQTDPQYADVAAEVREFLSTRIDAAVAVGVDRGRIIIDPGIGFGKKLQHNLALLAGTNELAQLGCPVLIGPSRKRFLGELTGNRPEETRTDTGNNNDPGVSPRFSPQSARLGGAIATCVETYRRGATIFRVHDVAPVKAALTTAKAIAESGE